MNWLDAVECSAGECSRSWNVAEMCDVVRWRMVVLVLLGQSGSNLLAGKIVIIPNWETRPTPPPPQSFGYCCGRPAASTNRKQESPILFAPKIARLIWW